MVYLLSEGLVLVTETSLDWASAGQGLSLTLLPVGYVAVTSQLLSVACVHLQSLFQKENSALFYVKNIMHICCEHV